jgi:hypothetical protein
MDLKRVEELSVGHGGGSMGKPRMIEKPLVVMFEQDKKIVCHIYPDGHDHKHYSLLICDLVRHVSRAFKVDEDEVWKWVDKERHNPTTEISQPS